LLLSVMVIAPDRGPVPAGVKVTLIVQFALAATLLPQVLVCAKSPAFVPDTATLVTLNAALPVFDRVTGCAALVVPWLCALKVRLDGDTLATGTAPVPDRLIVCGLLLALSVMVIEPVRAPAAVGVKVTLIVQFPLAATLVPQVLVSAKSPLGVILLMLSDALPELVSVTGWAALVVFNG
jgi:hypothetical protein